MGSSSKRRQTMAKMNRERALKEKRERKAEKKEEKKDIQRGLADGTYVLDREGNPVEVRYPEDDEPGEPGELAD